MELRGDAEADDGKSSAPIDDGLRTGCLVEAQSGGQETQDSGGSAKAEASNAHELEGHPNQVDLGRSGWSMGVAFELMEAPLGLLERPSGVVAFSSQASDLLALVAIVVAALFGFGFPRIATAFDFG